MEAKRKISSKNKSIFHIVIIGFIAICLLMGAACFQYYKQLQHTIKSESSEYMLEISKQMELNISKTINDNFFVLETIAALLENANTASYEELQSIFSKQQKYWFYQEIMLIDENGMAHDDTGKAVALTNDIYLQEAIINKKPALSASQTINGKECIIFAIPMEHLLINNIKISALAVSYDLSTFDKILSMTAFEGKGYSHIIRRDGTGVIRSSSKSASQSGYNILNSFARAKTYNDQNLQKVKADIASGKSGQFEFRMNNSHEYMIYTPMGTQNWYLLTFVPVAAVNAKSELLFKTTLIFCALITITFSLLLACLILIFYRHKGKLEQLAYVDAVTGGNTIQRFYDLAGNLLKSAEKLQYALIYTNIEKFKILNEQVGKEACNDVLRSIQKGIKDNLNTNECMGRLYADNFCILIEYKNETLLAERFDKWYKTFSADIKTHNVMWIPLMLEFGIYVIHDHTMPFPHMTDRAKLALKETSHEIRGKLRYAIYNEKLSLQLFREKQLEDRMEDALKNREFQVYLQPKYLTQNEKIGGAEALVRWMSASEGMIYPDEFIALFEKNGFIIRLDLWVFEEVCKTIRKWIDADLTPVKISVNCSRVHLRNPYFLEEYCKIAEKYHVSPQLIEMELTETTVFEDVEHLTSTIEDIHAAGFGCSMDDFGSGYSSLNLIQDIPVDTLKLDKIFFRKTANNLQRTESVVSSIISMAKALSMETVAEGAEEKFHVDMLKRLHCDYIQSYFFAKPMPISQFEQLLFSESIKDHPLEV